LINLYTNYDTNFKLISCDLTVLNAYSVDFQYPGENSTVEDAKTAFKTAKKIKKLLRESFHIIEININP